MTITIGIIYHNFKKTIIIINYKNINQNGTIPTCYPSRLYYSIKFVYVASCLV